MWKAGHNKPHDCGKLLNLGVSLLCSRHPCALAVISLALGTKPKEDYGQLVAECALFNFLDSAMRFCSFVLAFVTSKHQIRTALQIRPGMMSPFCCGWVKGSYDSCRLPPGFPISANVIMSAE